MLPIKWLPPDAYDDGEFTSKTDVWSFGVLMWEIFSQGRMPYGNMINAEVMVHVRGSYRLQLPQGCPEDIFAIMHACWHHVPAERPTFATCIDRIVACTQDTELMNTPKPAYTAAPVTLRGTNVAPICMPYNPDECERPDADREVDDPNSYLVPYEKQVAAQAQAQQAQAQAQAQASAGNGGGGGKFGAGMAQSVSAMTMATTVPVSY